MGWRRTLGFRQKSLRTIVLGRRSPQQTNGAGCLVLVGVFVVVGVVGAVIQTVKENSTLFIGLGAVVFAGLVGVCIAFIAHHRSRAKQAALEARRQEMAYAEWQLQQQETARLQAEAEGQAKAREIAQAEAQAKAEAERVEAEQRRIQARWELLVSRFGPDIAARIVRQDVWQGQTKAMLIEALGTPWEISGKVLKTKTKHIYKYGRSGRGFSFRVTVENGVVTGWEGTR